jgi:hypothetical protein
VRLGSISGAATLRSTVERARALSGLTTHEPQERGARHDDATSELDARKLAATHQLVGPRVACLAAATMVGADPVAERRQAAPRFGATHAVDPADVDVSGLPREVAGGIGVIYAAEAAGWATLMEQRIAAASLRPRLLPGRIRDPERGGGAPRQVVPARGSCRCGHGCPEVVEAVLGAGHLSLGQEDADGAACWVDVRGGPGPAVPAPATWCHPWLGGIDVHCGG